MNKLHLSLSSRWFFTASQTHTHKIVADLEFDPNYTIWQDRLTDGLCLIDSTNVVVVKETHILLSAIASTPSS